MHVARRLSIVMLLFCLAGFSTAWAQSTLHIGPGAGTKCAMGCAGDPNLIAGARNLDIYQTSNGAPTLQQPVLLILGVPIEFDHLMPTIPVTGSYAINPYPGGTTSGGSVTFAAGGTYGLISPISDGYFGNMGPGQEVYSFLGLKGANSSNNFTNWFDNDEEYLDLDPASFAIHVYAVNATLGPNGLINVSLVHDVPKGTVFVAYGIAANGKSYSVPFTEAGLKVSY
jgi:hypothetical protein